MATSVVVLVVVVVAVATTVLLASSIRVIKQYERGVHFRLGRVIAVRDPGLRLIAAFWPGSKPRPRPASPPATVMPAQLFSQGE